MTKEYTDKEIKQIASNLYQQILKPLFKGKTCTSCQADNCKYNEYCYSCKGTYFEPERQ